MNFSTPLFLFAFFPLTLALYWTAGEKGRPWVFTIASLLFCFWAGPLHFPVILISTYFNFELGKYLKHRTDNHRPIGSWLAAGIIFNLVLMLGFKLLVAYGPGLAATMKIAWPSSGFARLEPYILKSIALPVGISFYSFQAIAYLLDIAGARTSAETSLLKFTEYMTAFPKVVAGPITRYRQISVQLGRRSFDVNLAGEGAQRFILGLAKKTIIADRLSLIVDHGVFDQAIPNLSAGNAWLVLLCFTLQIYFDFSGYSDMAIGLGMIFGFRFPENFNHPYASRSISEFWRRWHMTLSGWFREVVFFPLERKRAAGSRIFNTYTNVLIVFLLTGIWHGVTINFLIWGLLHGLAICFENSQAGKLLRRLPSVFQHINALLVIMISWVFFRSNSPSFALAFLQNLVGIRQSQVPTAYSILMPGTASLWVILTLGVLFSFPVVDWMNKKVNLSISRNGWFRVAVSLALLAVCLVAVAGSTFQPYIYGNF